MPIIYNNQEAMIEGKKYYGNTIIKIKNYSTIFNIGSYIYYKNIDSLIEYHIVAKFYKILMSNTIPLEEVYYIINNLFPHDIAFIILSHYLKDSVNFKCITSKNVGCKQCICLKYPECLTKDSIYIQPQKSDKYNLLVNIITKKLSCNLKNLLNIKENFNINEIFSIKEMELSLPYKIYNTYNNGWGINLL